ncbi:MAG: hypothetical protein PUB67_06545 [Clostridiales bacterium]|nr:hypothetical protein [Clostridiales bacterium]
MIDSKWLNDPRFSNLSSEKKEFMTNLLSKMEGQSKENALKIYSVEAARMKKNGLGLTKDEASLMISYLMSTFTPAERAKWEQIKSILAGKSNLK